MAKKYIDKGAKGGFIIFELIIMLLINGLMKLSRKRK